mgnify:CR=1 FL=1
MKKRFLALAAAGSVFGIAVTAISSSIGIAMKINAEEESHVHNASCQIHHYARVNPTSKTSGVKEYWICCDDFNHKVEFSAPSTGVITDATHGEGFAVEETDERYIPPYTFPEVFLTPYAYDTPVTIENGKVISNSSAIHIKASVLTEIYEAGYTHMKFHSKGTGEDTPQVLSTADNWQLYYKRYANDNDNRYWLKTFKENGMGMKVEALQADGSSSAGGLELSDFSLFKSAVTESWGGGSMTDWATCTESNRYIAYENGELVMDNAGAGEYKQLGEIPSSLMGQDKLSEVRAFSVKPLASGYVSGSGSKENTRVCLSYNNAAYGYYFKNKEGGESVSSDGFISPSGQEGSLPFGLHKDRYDAGALSLGLDYPGALAIRVNYDVNVAFKDQGVTSYAITPLPNDADTLWTRTALTGLAFTENVSNQMNITFPNSVDHKGVNMNIIASVEPASNPASSVVIMNNAVKANLAFPKFAKQGENYVFEARKLMFKEKEGMSFVWKTNAGATNGTITFEYSWID